MGSLFIITINTISRLIVCFRGGFLFPYIIPDNKPDNSQHDDGYDGVLDVVTIFENLVLQLVFGYNGVKIPSQCCKNDIPTAGTNRCVEQEITEVHLSQPCGNTDEMTNARNESSGDSCQFAMSIEITLTFLYFFLIEQTQMTKTTVGKPINNGASYIISYHIVNGSTDISSEGRKKNDKPDVEVSSGSMIGGRGNNQFGRNGYNS